MDRFKVTQSFVRANVAKQYSPVRTGDLDYEQIRNSGMAYMPLAIDVPADVIHRELEQCKHLLVPHRDGYESHGWSSFCIHGRAVNQTREPEHYDNDRPMTWTPEAQELMPETVDWLRSAWPHGEYQRVRIMCIEPSGWIGVHSDYSQDQLGPINIAITQPEDCIFVQDRTGIVPFAPGRAMWMNVSRKHAVINNSNQPRYHMIIHQTESTDWCNLVAHSYKLLPKDSNQ